MIKSVVEATERRKNMVDFKMNLCDETSKLQISYSPNTSKVAYGISDLDGRVITRGDLEGNEHEICVKHLKTGRYVIWLMDGEDMIRTNFQVA